MKQWYALYVSLYSYGLEYTFIAWLDSFILRYGQWASYQTCKIAGFACTGNAESIFSATDFKRNRGLVIPASITARAWPLSDKKHIIRPWPLTSPIDLTLDLQGKVLTKMLYFNAENGNDTAILLKKIKFHNSLRDSNGYHWRTKFARFEFLISLGGRFVCIRLEGVGFPLVA